MVAWTGVIEMESRTVGRCWSYLRGKINKTHSDDQMTHDQIGRAVSKEISKMNLSFLGWGPGWVNRLETQ